MPDFIQRFRAGPYGTNEGDIWSLEDTEIGRRLKEERGLIWICEIMRSKEDERLAEHFYSVEETNPRMEMQELIRKAREGRKLWIEEQARRN